MATFLDIATDALQSIGQVGDGQSISPEESQLALRLGNRMLGKWSTKRLLLYTIGTSPFPLAAGVQDYTVGPAGATFTAPRPVFVEAAQAVIPGTLNEVPMNMLDKIKWGAIRDKGATCSIAGVPSDIWPEYTFPNLTFHVWPIPSTILTVKLGTWAQLQQFATIFDVLAFPPGYEEAIVPNLAMELADYFDQPPSQTLAQLAADGILALQGINAQGLPGSLGESRLLGSPNLDLPVPQGAPQR